MRYHWSKSLGHDVELVGKTKLLVYVDAKVLNLFGGWDGCVVESDVRRSL